MSKITHKEYTSILNTVFNEEVQPSLNELNQLLLDIVWCDGEDLNLSLLDEDTVDLIRSKWLNR
jgi:hypothetical protein